ncbi:MAG: hypothetical protein ACP5I4_17180, partial [Oceanipulchritudo sp.]
AYISNPDPNLGSLESWDYFKPLRRTRLISGADIPLVIRETVEIQHELGVDACIAPNLFIRNADSIDTAIALNFLNQTKAQAAEVTDRPVLGTIAIHRDALLSNNNFRDILDGLTGLDNPPDGYYLVVGSNQLQSTGNYIRSDLYDPEIIAAWMYMNYVLSLNGANIVNGYCFQLSPLMAICGAHACASGWSSGLRKFCINKYLRQGRGGSQPNARYVSNPLLSFIRQTDYADYKAVVPEIANGLQMDAVYDARDANQTEQAQQAWEALTAISQDYSGDLANIGDELGRFTARVEEAKRLWSYIQGAGFIEETEQNLERLDAMLEGVQLFTEWAELA